MINFPTRESNNKGTLIDNIFLDNTKHNCISVYVMENVLSEHDAQILSLKEMQIPLLKITQKKNKTRLINDQMIGSWESVYNADNVNSMFNNFHS